MDCIFFLLATVLLRYGTLYQMKTSNNCTFINTWSGLNCQCLGAAVQNYLLHLVCVYVTYASVSYDCVQMLSLPNCLFNGVCFFIWLFHGSFRYLRSGVSFLRFYVPLKNISLIWRRHHYRRRATKFRPMLGAQGLWAERDISRATGPRFFWSHPKDRPITSPLTTHEGMWRIYSNPDPHGGWVGGGV
jgi:hypothetical protein